MTRRRDRPIMPWLHTWIRYSHALTSASQIFFAPSSPNAPQVVGNVTTQIRAKGSMWQNTLIVMSSDNGGPIYKGAGANNHPLKGGKVSDWEGGVRVNAWVSGGFLPAGARGTKVEGYMHIADWCDETRSVFVESSAERVRSFACGPGLRRSASSRAWCPPTPQQQPQGCRLWTRSGSSRKRFFLSQRKSEFCAREIFLPVDTVRLRLIGHWTHFL